MTRRLGSGSLVIATHNAGKLKEISALLDPYGVKCLSAGSLGLPEPAETGSTRSSKDNLLEIHGLKTHFFTKDGTVRARILVRVDRLIHGNPGVHRNLTDGISELKIDVGPGYRVYYMQRGNVLLLLLAGGDKSTQAKDIARALRLARDFEE